MRGQRFRPDPPTKAQLRAKAALLVTGASDEALARLTADTLCHCYGMKPDAAAAMLAGEAQRRHG